MEQENIDDFLDSILSDQAKNLDLMVLFEKKIAEYGISRRKVIDLLNIDKDTLDEILSGVAKQPSLPSILKVAQFLEIEEQTIINILKRQKKENAEIIEGTKRVTFILKNFDIKRLGKIGFFTEINNAKALTDRVLHFFDYSNIYEFNDRLYTPLFSKTRRSFTDKMRDFWIKSAYRSFLSINNTNEYDREKLKELIPKIRPKCQDVENGLLTVCRALANIGVTVIMQNKLETTQIRGATFIVNNKPCIVLTDLNKRYPAIWQTLMHELYHVLYDFDKINDTVFHLSGEPDLFLIEEEKANQFGLDYFCSYEEYKYIKHHITNPFLVQKFANSLEIHPSLIYLTFQYYVEKESNQNFWGAFKEQFPDCSSAIEKLHPITWKENSISEISESIRKTLQLNTI